MMTDTPAAPALVGLGPGPTAGLQLPLTRSHQLIGQAANCEIRLTEGQVGPQHAVVTQRDGRTWVQDMGTPGGTFVNGQRLGRAPHQLRRGDVVVFGTVALRLELVTPPPDRPAPQRTPLFEGERDSLRSQRRARQLDALVRDAATVRVAARLLGCGAVAFVLGFALFTAGALGLLTGAGQDRISQPLGPAVFGVPCGLVGWLVSAAGMALLVAGIVMHYTAAARYRLVDRELR
jgi:Inner membrane component of T3SS, cytoplasmic domain